MRIHDIFNALVYLLALFYGGILFLAVQAGQDVYYLGIFSGAFLVCYAGLMFKKAWAARLILWVAGASVVAGTCLFITQELYRDFLVIGFMITSVFGFIYGVSPLREYYQRGGRGRVCTILLIDDDKTLLKLLQRNFQKEGYIVLTAETGEKGLDLVENIKPDLILLDVILPGIKGRAVCTRLKANPRTCHIPVLFLTAKDSQDDVAAELAAGGVAHITKPIDFHALSLQVKKYLNP